MVKIKEFFNKHQLWIFIILVVLLGFKSCQSCRRNKQIQYYKSTSSIEIDSIINQKDIQIKRVDSLQNEILLRDQKIDHLRKENELLKETNKHYKMTNNELVKTLNKE